MRLLFVHADHLEFEATTEEGEGLGETEGVPMAGRMEDCVAAFTSVESGDEADLDAVVENAADELRDAADQLNARKVVLYPCEYLSDDPAESEHAATVLRDLEAALDGEYEVLRAPVGWHKAFELSSKGHPFAERSQHVGPERADVDRAPSEWKLLFPDGEVRDPREAETADCVSADVRAVVEAEVKGDGTENGVTPSGNGRPPRADLMREKGLADHDDSGDASNLRWYPRGTLIRDSLTAHVTDLAVEYGAMPVETPAAATPDARATRDRDEQFGARRLSIVRDADLAERDLPLRLYETADCTTPTVRAACADLERAREELRAQANLAVRIGEDLGVNSVPTIRATREFYEADETWVERLVEGFDSPALLEILPERHRCWAAKVDFAAVGRLAEPIETATVLLDVESAERFDVEYAGGEERRHPPVVRLAPVGDLESAVAAPLETAAGQDVPRLPTWLSPTQVRFVPVGDEHVEYCDALAADLEAAGVRADVDDRDETVGERIARADADWVPYYAVVGDRELDSDALAVTVRAEQVERELPVAELRDAVLDDVGDLPKKRRYLPARLSRAPRFADR